MELSDYAIAFVKSSAYRGDFEGSICADFRNWLDSKGITGMEILEEDDDCISCDVLAEVVASATWLSN